MFLSTLRSLFNWPQNEIHGMQGLVVCPACLSHGTIRFPYLIISPPVDYNAQWASVYRKFQLGRRTSPTKAAISNLVDGKTRRKAIRMLQTNASPDYLRWLNDYHRWQFFLLSHHDSTDGLQSTSLIQANSSSLLRLELVHNCQLLVEATKLHILVTIWQDFNTAPMSAMVWTQYITKKKWD